MRFTFVFEQASADVRTSRLSRSRAVLTTPQGTELVLFDMRAERYFTLNEVGGHVWRMLAQPTTFATVVDSVRREFDADRDVVERDVAALLRSLERAGLVAADAPLPEPR